MATSSQAEQKRLPSHAYLEGESVEIYAKLTSKGVYALTEQELLWQKRYRHLKGHGYLLRPRYSPDWKPSWLGTNLMPDFCEDSILLTISQIMDARRTSTNELVAIKTFYKHGQESHVARFLSNITDPQNHTVPILDIFPDPLDPELALMVMPYLRPCNNPEFATIGEVVEFVDQTVDGMVFMHKHNVAHRDMAVENIMMDARALYPQGHHPVRLGYTPDTLYPASPLPRAGRGIKYFYIDFGLATHFPAGASTRVVGDVGKDADVPELSETVPYDAFKVDIFTLGHLFSLEFQLKYKNADFLLPLIEPMTQRLPELRPTADQVLRMWQEQRATLNETLLRWRLVRRDEQPLQRVVNDTVAVAWEGVYRLKKFVRES
ncbi:kinase-like protein [Trametes polyzona]|nr:kinase-like protein [Trametes polyzona]